MEIYTDMRKPSPNHSRLTLTESTLRKLVRQEIAERLFEGPDDGEAKAKAGSATAGDAEGQLDIKKMADALGLDAGKLKTSVSNLRGGKRTATDDKIFGDVFAKLLDASPEDTVKAMTVLKKVSADDKDSDKK